MKKMTLLGFICLQIISMSAYCCGENYLNQIIADGKVSHILYDENKKPIYISFSGPVQLTYNHKVIKGQGVSQHPNGFSSPIGRLRDFPDKAFSTLTVSELISIGILPGEYAEVAFLSGVQVQGYVKSILRKNKKIILISFEKVTVLGPKSNILYAPSWGDFDMAVWDTLPLSK